MAIRLLPFRQYSEEDVVNLFANDVANNKVTTIGAGDAGVFVQVSAGDLSLDPIQYETQSYLGKTDYPFIGRDQYPVVPLKVSAATTGQACLGVTLLQTAQYDENDEKLLYYPQKKLETQSVLSGEATPILTKGIVTLAASPDSQLPNALDGDLPDPGDWLVVSDSDNGGNAGNVSGLAQDGGAHAFANATTTTINGTGLVSSSSTFNPRQIIGQVLGTGIRLNRGVAADQFAGPSIGTGSANTSGHYLIARIDCGN